MVRAVALYLPQFHPTADNDTWWGPGFTEWHNVARARPLFRGHRQPRLPGALGFYDLRLDETRVAQARLARTFGIEAFAYWHYWFGSGRRALARPFQEVLESGTPDFGFCLAWANESWRSNTWTAVRHRAPSSLLIEQTYSARDVDEHFDYLVRAFHDNRYLRVDGRPLLLVQRPEAVPADLRLVDRWRDRASQAGLDGLYLVAPTGRVDPLGLGYDAVVSFPPLYAGLSWRLRLRSPYASVVGPKMGRVRRIHFSSIAEMHAQRADGGQVEHPGVLAGWDNTPRRGTAGQVATAYSPIAFRDHVASEVARLGAFAPERRLLFVRSWNEWAEGNYLEPDAHHGDAFLRGFADGVRVGRAQWPSAGPPG